MIFILLLSYHLPILFSNLLAPLRDTLKESAFDTPPPSTKPVAPVVAAAPPAPAVPAPAPVPAAVPAVAPATTPIPTKTEVPTSQKKSNFKYTSPAVNFEDGKWFYI